MPSTVNAMKNGLEVISFSRIFRIKEVEQLYQELRKYSETHFRLRLDPRCAMRLAHMCVNVLLDNLWVGLVGDHEPQQELIDILQVWP